MYYLLLVSLLFFSTGYCESSESSSYSDSYDEMNSRAFSCDYMIYASDIIPNGFVIDKEGQWCLEESVEYDPANSNPAITIAASNVTLDLNSKVLAQSASDEPFVIGIAIKEDVSNVTVVNGTVENFTQAGVFVNPPSSLPLGEYTGPSNKAATHIEVSYVRAMNNGMSGFERAERNGMGGIVVFNANDVTIFQCEAVDNYFCDLLITDVKECSVEESYVDSTKFNF